MILILYAEYEKDNPDGYQKPAVKAQGNAYDMAKFKYDKLSWPSLNASLLCSK